MEAVLQDEVLSKIAWNALHGLQNKFALSTSDACRYVTDVAPFAAIANTGAEALSQLRSLVAPGETIALVEERPAEHFGFAFEKTIDCLQMVLVTDDLLGKAEVDFVQLGAGDVPEMLALTTLTAPGPFRTRTYEMGNYYGVRMGGELIAMAGERMAVDQFREISAVCTHPEHTGTGYAAALITKLAREHQRDGIISFLHVAAGNSRAIALYERLGFAVRREMAIHLLTRLHE